MLPYISTNNISGSLLVSNFSLQWPKVSEKQVSALIQRRLRGAFNKFPDFFVQAFKIVVVCYCYTS